MGLWISMESPSCIRLTGSSWVPSSPFPWTLERIPFVPKVRGSCLRLWAGIATSSSSHEGLSTLPPVRSRPFSCNRPQPSSSSWPRRWLRPWALLAAPTWDHKRRPIRLHKAYSVSLPTGLFPVVGQSYVGLRRPRNSCYVRWSISISRRQVCRNGSRQLGLLAPFCTWHTLALTSRFPSSAKRFLGKEVNGNTNVYP